MVPFLILMFFAFLSGACAVGYFLADSITLGLCLYGLCVAFCFAALLPVVLFPPIAPK